MQPQNPNSATPYQPMQTPQHPGQKTGGETDPRKEASEEEGRAEKRDEDGDEAEKGDDEGLAGVDTDGDGKPVKPGHKPGQSHGRGLPEKD